MRLVHDASVAIAASRAHEPSSAAARARVGRAIRRHDELVVPSLFGIEVAGATKSFRSAQSAHAGPWTSRSEVVAL
jgi:hypothetical protein